MKSGSIRILPLGALCLIASTGALAADTQQSGSPGASQNQSAGVLPEVEVRDLVKNPDKFAGQPVAVTGKVSRIEGSNAFIVEGSGLLNNKILVVVAQPQRAGVKGQQPGTAATTIKEKEKVRLTGKVEELGLTKVEEKYQPGLKAEVKEEFLGKMPILVVPPNGIQKVG